MVPIDARMERTIEDPSEGDPDERVRRFGQKDHFRLYGSDLVQRLQQAGLAVAQEDYVSSLDAGVVRRYRLSSFGGPIFMCRKAPSARSAPADGDRAV